MEELIREKNRTVIIVSHVLEQLRDLCSQVIWLDAGEIVLSGDPETVIDAYRESQQE